MPDNKFGFTVDDIIAEFDKKKAEPPEVQDAQDDITEEFDAEFSEELSADGEYVPRHAKPAPPEEISEPTEPAEALEPAEQQTEADESSTADEETSVTEKTEASDNAETQDKSDEPETVSTAEEYTETAPEGASTETDEIKQDEASPDTNENPENNITDSNIIDDISEEEINEPSEPEIVKPSAVLDGVIPAESFSGTSEQETAESTFSSVFTNGLDDIAETEDKQEDTVEVLSADIPDWNDILPDGSADIEEAVNDAISDIESEEIEEDESDPEEYGENTESSDDVEEIFDDDEPEASEEKDEISEIPSDEENNASEETTEENTNDIPPFEPAPIVLTENEAKEDAEKKEKKNILKEIFPWKGDSVFEMIRKIVFIIAVVIFIGAGVMLASTLIQSKRAVKDLEAIKEVVTTTAKTTIDSDGNVITIAPTEEEEQQHNIDIMSYYKGISDKVVGFIELEGCDIYQPVVHDPEDTTNTYYLTHTYYDEQNKGGAIFMDYRCTISEDHVSPNIVLYGHNQEDGTMFGNLRNYKQDLDFYAANPTITLRTEYETGTYLIYAYFVTNALEKQDSNGVVFHYQDYIEVLNDEATFDWYMGEIQSRNQIISPVKAEYGDKLLLLSTCSNEFSNSRFVVFARKLRDGESVSDYDFTSASFNPYARGVDWTAIMSGITTTEEETTVPDEENSDEDDETTTKKKKKKKKQTDTSDEENADSESSDNSDETTVPPDASDEDGDNEETTSKKKKTTAETTEETTEETTKKKSKNTTETTVEETSEEETTTTKKKKTTTKETSEEETTTTKKKKTTTKDTSEEETTTTKKKKTTTKETTAETSDTEETTVTNVPETEEEETTTVTAGSVKGVYT
ncbi:MAG: sortase domain-bontaining protein [Oscillospiraceae bacterium]